MSEKITLGDSLVLMFLAALAAAWGIAGSLDVGDRTHPGFKTSEDHVITWLAPGGTAERINMQLGDRVIRIDGNEVEDTATISRLLRVPEGERRSFTVTRDDQTIRYRPAFVALNTREQALEHLETIVGFAFLLIPLAAVLTRPKHATRVLALMGLGLSLHFFDGPYFASYDVYAVTKVVVQLFFLLGLASMVHFLLLFPSSRPLLGKPWGRKLVYLPVLLVWAVDAWRILFTPRSDTALASWSEIFTQTGMLAYLVAGFLLLCLDFFGASSQQRSRFALSRMFWLTLLASVPLTLVCILPGSGVEGWLPYQEYYFVLLALVPMAWSGSAARQ